MKCLKYFLVVGLVLISLSSNTTRTSRLSEGIYPGNLFSDITNLENVSGTKINLSDLKGQKVLVNLWAAYDAASRRDNVLFSNVIEKENYPVKMVSICFDQSESVFKRTVSLDQIDIQYQFMAKSNVRADLFDRYQLEKGFKNYLIDENGLILAINLTPSDLGNLLTKN